MKSASNVISVVGGIGGSTFFMLRREPLYHKLQYSKVPKFDVAAAILGVGVGAFVVYLSLCTLGSAGADLSDLTVVVWYAAVWASIAYFYLLSSKLSVSSAQPRFVVLVWVKEVLLSLFFYLSRGRS
jgi:hypothetical protein